MYYGIVLAIVVRYKSRNPWKTAICFLFEKKDSLSYPCIKAGNHNSKLNILGVFLCIL